MTVFQIIAAVLAGNVITFVWCFTLWRVGRAEQMRKEPTMLQLLVLMIPPLLLAYGFWSL